MLPNPRNKCIPKFTEAFPGVPGKAKWFKTIILQFVYDSASSHLSGQGSLVPAVRFVPKGTSPALHCEGPLDLLMSSQPLSLTSLRQIACSAARRVEHSLALSPSGSPVLRFCIAI